MSLTATVALASAITMLMHVALIWTLSGRGFNTVMTGLVIVFSGLTIPLPLFPDWLQPFLYWQPFRGLADVPYRIYSGNIGTDAARVRNHPANCLDGADHRRRLYVAFASESRAWSCREDDVIDALALYGRMIGLSIRAQMQYRASFLMMSVGHFITTGVEMVGIWALFERFGNLLPWTLPQVAFFYGVVNISFAFTDALARGFDLFGAQFIKTGNFDRVLLRPRSTVLQLAGHEFTLFRVGRLLQGVIVLVWASQHLALEWDAARVALLAFTMLATFVFFYGLIILGAVMSFWTTESLEIMNTADLWRRRDGTVPDGGVSEVLPALLHLCGSVGDGDVLSDRGVARHSRSARHHTDGGRWLRRSPVSSSSVPAC